MWQSCVYSPLSLSLARDLSLAVSFACLYPDSSYSVNSANMGPYGDAIHLEFVPTVERMFRGIAEVSDPVS